MESEVSNLREYAVEELRRAGMLPGDRGDSYDKYNEMCGEAVLELIDVFSEQGHSGFSASMVLGMFTEVANYRPLGPLTNDPDEWQQVNSGSGAHRDPTYWQSRRRPDAFSEDGGHTYYLLDECRKGWKRKWLGKVKKYYQTEKIS